MPEFDIDKPFYLLLALMFIALSYFLERVYRTDKKWLVWIILFPPLALIFIYQNWPKTRFTCFFFALFYVLIIMLEIISGMPFTHKALQIFSYIFCWPYYLFFNMLH